MNDLFSFCTKPLAMIGGILLGLVMMGDFAHAEVGHVRLTPGVPLVVPADTPGPVNRAVEDLQRDLEKVFGKKSPLVEDPSEWVGESGIMILLEGATRPEWSETEVTGPDAHGIHVRNIGGTEWVILEGADLRGAIYAIYSFSDEFLDIPPLWYWSDWVCERREWIDVPRDTKRLYPAAHVRWRAWFNNDTDFLQPWLNRSEDHYQAMFETILRLKYNTLEVGGITDLSPGAAPHAVRADISKANERGLAITHHHTSPLGSNLSNWEAFWRKQGQEPPPLSVKSIEALETFWTYHAEAADRAGLEVIWTLVFRGARDIPFWETYADSPSEDEERARVINEMLARQAEIVKKVTGNPTPEMRTTFYNEGTTLLTAGLLEPPADPSLIWTFVAARRDHFPTEFVRGLKPVPGRRIGYYLNFQFTSTGSHLAPAEGPWKMADNYRIVQAAGEEAMAFTVVNAGNIREHLIELAANGEMMWRFEAFDATRFLHDFCRRYYGEDHAVEIAALYRDYYDAYWMQKTPDIPGFDRQYLFQDMRYARAAEKLLRDMAQDVSRPNPLDGHPLDDPDRGSIGYFRVVPSPEDANQVEALLRGTAGSKEKFAAVVDRATQLRPTEGPGRVFFTDHLRARAKIMVSLNVLLHETTLAYQSHGKWDERRRHLVAAISAADAVKAALDETRHGSFINWYDSDRVFGLERLRASLRKEADRKR